MDRIVFKILGVVIIILCLFLIERSTQKAYYTITGQLSDKHVYATIDGIGIEYTVKEASRIGTSLPVFFTIVSGIIFGSLLLFFTNHTVKLYSFSLRIVSIFYVSITYIPILLLIWILYIDYTLRFEYAVVLGVIPFSIVLGVVEKTRLELKQKFIAILIAFFFFISFLILVGFTSNIYTVHHGDWGQVDINGFTLFKGVYFNYLLSPGFIVFRILNVFLLVITGPIYFGALAFRGFK